MVRDKLNQYTRVIRDALSSEQMLLFQSDMDVPEFKRTICMCGYDYIYVELFETEEQEEQSFYFVQCIYSCSSVKLSGIRDRVDQIMSAYYQQSNRSFGITYDFMYMVLRELNDSGLHVIHIEPVLRVGRAQHLIQYLRQFSTNNMFPNLKFVLHTDLLENSLIGNLQLFCRKNLNGIKSMEKVFISYSWQDVSNHIVKNDIVPALEQNKIDYVLDKNDCGYLTNIPEFEREIGQGHKIIMVVSDPYVKSVQCMYEMAYTFECGNALSRVYPVYIALFDRNDDQYYEEIVKYWREKAEALDQKIAQMGEPENELLTKELSYIKLIQEHLAEFWDMIRSANTLSLTDLATNNFEKLIKRMGLYNPTPVVEKYNIETTGTAPVMNFTFNGGNPQVNTNTGSGSMVINNTYKQEVSKETEDRCKEIQLVEALRNSSAPRSQYENVQEEVNDIALKMFTDLKSLVEKNAVGNLLYRHGKPDETDWQLLFDAMIRIAHAYSGMDVRITRENNPGVGEIDFMFSRGAEAVVCVEMKLSSNSQILHGYTDQLRGYMEAESAIKGIFVIIEVDDQHAKQISDVIEKDKQAKEAGDKSVDVIIMNGRQQVSASKSAYIAPRS